MQKLLKAVEQGLLRNQLPKPMLGLPNASQTVVSMGGLVGAGSNGSPMLMGGAMSDLHPQQRVNGSPASGLSMLPTEPPSGPQARQAFDLDKPLREARDGFERCYFEFHLAQEGGSMTRVAEKTGPGAHAPVPQVEATRRRSQRGKRA